MVSLLIRYLRRVRNLCHGHTNLSLVLLEVSVEENYNDNFRIAKNKGIFQVLSRLNKKCMPRLYIYFFKAKASTLYLHANRILILTS